MAVYKDHKARRHDALESRTGHWGSTGTYCMVFKSSLSNAAFGMPPVQELRTQSALGQVGNNAPVGS